VRALTPDRLAEIRALAEAALRESVACGDDEDTWWEGPEASVSASDAIFPAARDHVVAASPDVVLALVREALAGREVAQAFKAYISEFGIEHGGERDEDENDYPCPEDDTCRCEHVEHINRVIAAYDAARAGERGT